MKRRRFSGIRYNYLIELGNTNNHSLDVWARYGNTIKVSCITNLNFIISALRPENDNSDLYYESTWIFYDKFTATKIYNTLVTLFQIKSFVEDLEKNLDEDRKIGRWNSNYLF